MQTIAQPIPAARAWLWAVLTVIGLVGACFAAFGVATTVASQAGIADAGPGGLRLDLAGFLLLIGAFGTGAVLVAGRMAFGSWLDARRRHLILPAAGIALAVGIELTLHEWAEGSIGYYDWQLIGWTAGLSFAVVLVAIAAFGVAVAPPTARHPPTIAVGLGAGVVLLIVLSNVPGLGDGVGPNGMPLAIMVGLSAAYAIAVLIASLRTGHTG